MTNIRKVDERAFTYPQIVERLVRKWMKFTGLTRPTIDVKYVKREDSTGTTYHDEYRIAFKLGTDPVQVPRIVIHELAHLMPGSGVGHEQAFYANLFTLYQHFGIRKNSEAVWNDIITHAKTAIPAAKAVGMLPSLRG